MSEKFLKIKSVIIDKRFVLFIWVLLGLIAGIKHATKGVFNDYLIFKSVYYHTVEQVNLYLYYPELNGDCNHYGPIFSLVFAPFALLPDSVGTILWDLAMSLVLFIAIYKLPFKWNGKVIIFYICLQGLYANAVNSETNTLMAAMIIGSFLFIKKENDFWAACLIALGMMIKLYGILGFAFFFFSKHKTKLVGSFVFWCAVFFVLPMLISSPQFILQTYVDWYESLVYKNGLNMHSLNQDISVMGMIRRILGDREFSNLFVLVPAAFIFLLQYVNVKNFNDIRFQLGILASSLLFIVLFSTGSEPCTYIIATLGVAIWFVLQRKPYNKGVIFLLILTLVMVFATSGMMPSHIRNTYIKGYALEALPHFIVWLILVYQLIRLKHNTMSDYYIEEEK